MSSKKRGRKEKPYRTADGQYVNGLRRRPNDGRWVVMATGAMFSESDELRAVERFRRTTDPLLTVVVGGVTVNAKRSELVPVADELDRLIAENDRPFWDRVEKEIRTRPQYVADKIGIEQIGYLTDIKPPTPLPTFSELTELYTLHCRVDNQERNYVVKAWNEFVADTQIQTLKDINPQTVIAYRDKIYESEFGPKTQQHKFNRIRRMIAFSVKRAICVDELTKILNYLKLLTPNDTAVSINPNPIEVADYRALLEAAHDQDRAMLLLMLNCGMLLVEVVRLEWQDIRDDKTLITHRRKKGKCVRIAILWQETIDALAKMKRKGDYIFVGQSGKPLTKSGAGKRYRSVRAAAKIASTVEANQIRDGASTAASSANVNEDIVKLLMGHRNGMGDFYSKRSPQQVKIACDAIYKHYMR
jgi:integrase